MVPHKYSSHLTYMHSPTSIVRLDCQNDERGERARRRREFAASARRAAVAEGEASSWSRRWPLQLGQPVKSSHCPDCPSPCMPILLPRLPHLHIHLHLHQPPNHPTTHLTHTPTLSRPPTHTHTHTHPIPSPSPMHIPSIHHHHSYLRKEKGWR